ncbi:DUF6090 family protein [Flagellimonas sp.]|uniref:DUF6090 family protein n=1 Tax=Flagellimonas sp. TaxID=2058762 RepID=UPI003B501B46
MIKFFRKIRQKLLAENRFSKYLLYAIGEIILVVIGILIALQINNWNQKRLDKKLEITMLQEIKTSLESDLKSYEILELRIKMKQEGIQELLQMIASKKTYPDSVLLKSYNKMSSGNNFHFNMGGYEGLRSVGLDKISNDSLRRELILIYEVDYPAVDAFLKSSDEANRNKDYKLNLHNALWKHVQIQMPDESYKIVSRPINSEGFLQQPELLDRIKVAQDNMNYKKFRLDYLKNIITFGIDLVNKELNNQSGDK